MKPVPTTDARRSIKSRIARRSYEVTRRRRDVGRADECRPDTHRHCACTEELRCVGPVAAAGDEEGNVPKRPFESGSWTLYHSGDTTAYGGLAERLRPFALDIALLPINGKLENMNGRDAARIAKETGAGLAVPCHFEMFEFNTAPPDDFVDECARLGQPYQVLRAGERLTLVAQDAGR
jgi:hypothetical protein